MITRLWFWHWKTYPWQYTTFGQTVQLFDLQSSHTTDALFATVLSEYFSPTIAKGILQPNKQQNAIINSTFD